MRLERTTLVIWLMALAAAGWCGWRIHTLQERVDWFSRNGAPRASSNAPPPNLEQRLKKLEAASPRLGEIMTGVQLHFAKLYFASQARNWDLARFERGEVEEGLEAVAALRPEENGVNLAGIIGAFKQTQLIALQDAIEMKDRGLFHDAYRDATLMCNTCHRATGRPFIMIIIPTNSPVANQQWERLAFSQ